MAKRVSPSNRDVQKDNHPGMEREIAVSKATVGSEGIYASVVTTPPGGGTLVHHHGECETSVYVLSGRARFTWGPTGVERELFADEGDFVYIPAGEIHTESNVSLTGPLIVIVTRNCAEPVTFVVEDST
jgi:uncharacterized RmlC-like cupin family protein